jgi:hypothetical protein
MQATTWPHGSVEARLAGRPHALRDSRGALAWSCAYGDDGELRSARFRTPADEHVDLRPGGAHPIFGPALRVVYRGVKVAQVARVALEAPAEIPAMDDPAALPPGAGTAILSFLAGQARAAGVACLRYRGPYPTAALFDSLLECFRVRGGVREALARFPAGAEERALAARMDEVEVDFEPAPFERRWCGRGVCVQLRDGVEKLYVHGRAFSRDAAGARRLRWRQGGYEARVEIAGEPWCTVAELDERGELIAGPHPWRPVESRLSGHELPVEVRRALADALPPRAPALLQAALVESLLATPLRWGDPGPSEASAAGDHIVIHPALADRLEGRELLEAIARAVEPVAQRLAQRRLAQQVALRDRPNP